MKRLFRISLLLCLPILVLAQNKEYYYFPYLQHKDSLSHIYQNAKNDSVRLEILKPLAWSYLSSDVDSVLFYQEKGLALSKKLQSKIWEAEYLFLLGSTYVIQEKMPNAYLKAQAALAIASDPSSEKNIWNIAPFYFQKDATKSRLTVLLNIHYLLSNILRSARKFDESTYHIQELKKIADNIEDRHALGTYYLEYVVGNNARKRKLDSAILNTRKAKDYFVIGGYEDMILSANIEMGLHYLRMKVYDSVRKYALESIRDGLRLNYYHYVGKAYFQMGSLFLDDGKIDSSLLSVRNGLHIINEFDPMISQKLLGYRLLIEIFQKQKKYDSAFYYQGISMVLRDSINRVRDVNQLNELAMQQHDKQIELESAKKATIVNLILIILMAVIITVIVISIIQHRNGKQKHKANIVLEQTLTDLKDTQTQLIQSEKMASLGELTAGIAHEIQNPLNFVNNFSEVNLELIEEVRIEKLKEKGERDEQLEAELLNDIAQNLEKISHHGKRAESIVKGMLQHSRSSTGVKELTNINTLTDEYLRLAYHGLRAKDKSFNATMITDYDDSIGKINIIPQDMGRVILNLFTNAFFAVNEKSVQAKSAGIAYEPTVTVTTRLSSEKENAIIISVEDNGNGIPQKVIDKIFQPFFTTKPTGQGTGLGLSMSYDIVTKGHGGKLTVETKENENTIFSIILPL